MSNVRRGAFALATIIGSDRVLANIASRAMAIAFALALVVAGTSHTVFAQPLSGDLYLPVINPCNGDVVEIVGTMTTDVRFRTDKTGGVHLTFHLNQHGSGNVQYPTGTVAKYNFNSGVVEQLNDQSPGVSESLLLTKWMLIRHGETGTADDFMVKSMLRVHFNADGVLSTSFVSSETVCPTGAPTP